MACACCVWIGIEGDSSHMVSTGSVCLVPMPPKNTYKHWVKQQQRNTSGTFKKHIQLEVALSDSESEYEYTLDSAIDTSDGSDDGANEDIAAQSLEKFYDVFGRPESCINLKEWIRNVCNIIFHIFIIGLEHKF